MITSRGVQGVLHQGMHAEPALWQVPEEVPVALLVNSTPFAVMMATPADLEDFAVGFMVTEGVVDERAPIRGIVVLSSPEGLTVDVALDEADVKRERMVARSLIGRTGCGLCGIENLRDAVRLPEKRLDRPAISPGALACAFEHLRAHQPMNAVNHTVHAAAWCDEAGQILLAREDVGRHNALDKLGGALLRQGTDRSAGFILLSSRCSFELVQKCAVLGVGTLATVSAPTALALLLAEKAGLKLAALSRNGVMIFEGAPDHGEH